MTTNTTPKRPTHRINYEVKGKDGKTVRYVEIGGAWLQSDGKGYSFRFDLMPPPGSHISMRVIERQEGATTGESLGA